MIVYKEECYSDELQHYGIKGMRWGVRRASKKLAKASTTEERDKAMATLEKHRNKAVKKVQRLERRQDKLDKNLAKSTKQDMNKAAKLSEKAAKFEQKYSKNMVKANRRILLGGDKRRVKLISKAQLAKFKAEGLNAKATSCTANYENAKAKVESNDRLMQAFKVGIRDIDGALANKGRRYLNA